MTLPTSRWYPTKNNQNVMPRTVHWTPLLMANIPLMTPFPVIMLTHTRNLIPRVRIRTLNPTVGRVRTLRVAMIVTGGNFSDMFGTRKTHKPTTKKQQPRGQSSSRSRFRETESQKKPTSGKSGMPKGPFKVTPKAVDKLAQEVGEDLVWKFQEEEGKQEHQPRSKKSKKDSDQKKEQEEEYQRQKKKKKKEKEQKEREEREAKEAKLRTKQQQLKADKRTARAKLIHNIRLEKYSEELPELHAYRRKYVSSSQHSTVNLASHVRYLEMIQQDKSLYPNRNIMLGTRLVELLLENGRNAKVDELQAVIDKGLNCHAPATSLTWTVIQSYIHCTLSGVYKEVTVKCLTAQTTTMEMTRTSAFMTWYLSCPYNAYALPRRLRSTTVGL